MKGEQTNGAAPKIPVGAVPVNVLAVRGGGSRSGVDQVAQEEPLELQIGTVPIAVVMRTPGHDEELAMGFLLSESAIASPSELESLRHCTEAKHPAASGNVMRAQPALGADIDLHRLHRNFFVGSSCGVCGKSSIEAALRLAEPLKGPFPVSSWSANRLLQLPQRMAERQAVFALTGGLHAAALFSATGELLVVREDVGRHNAVDKVLGWTARAGLWPPADCALAISGRVSFEIVQKALQGRIPIIAAVSAPTSLAVSLAQEVGITVVGFVRGKRLTVYSHAERLPFGSEHK